MAKKKKRRSRQGMVSKGINIGLTLLAMSRPLTILFTNLGNIGGAVKEIIKGATFGFSEGAFDMGQGTAFYGPMGAAAAIKFIHRYATKHFPVRR